jgi:threonine/homoserine/homoserine lactone efflux protein
MFEYLLVGGGFAFAAAVQPGPLQAFLLSQVATKGWKRTLPAAFSPLLSDGPIAILTLVVLRQVPAGLTQWLQVAGGLLLLYLAVAAYRDFRRAPGEVSAPGGSAPRTVLQAAAVNILNPNPYLGWSLVLGPTALKAWRQGPANAVALIGAFYGVMVVCLGAIILLFGATRFFGPRERRGLVMLSAVALAGLGAYQLVVGLRAVLGE